MVFFRCNNDDALAAIVDLESGSVLRYERPCQVATGAGEVPCIAHQLYRCVAGQIVSGPCFGENDGAVPVLSGPEWGWPDWKVWALDPESILRLDGERAPPGVRIREQDPTFFHLVIEDEASLRQAATPPPVTDPPDWVWVPHGPYPDKASFPHYTGGLLDFWFDPRARTSSLSRALDGHLELLIPISWTWHHDGWLSSWSRPRVQSIAWHDAAFDLRSRGRSYTFRESDTACDWDFPAYAWSYD